MNRKIVICDDDLDIVEMLEIVLEDSNLEVITETDSRKVIELISDNHPDVILLDLWMPVITGDQVVKQIRSDNSIANIPILIMSAAQDGHQIAQEVGANGFISKPFDIDQLIERVQEFIT
ncbi:response regulator [Pedobacter agri]|uniref:response regulator n=1 Tax=Pedobacter agri TaxID=454586 RepID=UPI00277EF7CF|nr:response regulator [Pedobacter agri]MDQ1142902.1 CheY-like chemotaxis protein [Pedobacter agri]